MTISWFKSSLIHTLLCLGIAALAACGGGGGGGDGGGDPNPPDTTPNAFSFTASANVAPSAVVTSPAITVSGINFSTPISITGGQYSVDGGAFTSSAGTVKNGQSVVVKVTASAITNTEVQAVVTIGGVVGAFSVTTAPDVTPNIFTFNEVFGASLSSVNISEAITLSGIDIAVPISITGGEYAINGGSYTTSAGTISAGQSVSVKLTAAETTNTSKEAVLTIGGISATYRVKTIADMMPEAFSFTAATNVEPNSENISNQITVTGIDGTAPISITNGEYSINGGVYTSAAGTVSVNQSVTLKVIAPEGTDSEKIAVLTIGDVAANYSVSTLVDEQAPVAEFKFPTPYTMSEANSVKVRGTVTDYNAITSVQVKVNNGEPFDVTPKAEGDYSSWTADIPLTSNAENTIVVTTEDEKGNVDDNAAQVVIRQAPVASAFPDEVNSFTSSIDAGLVYDHYDGRNRILVPGGNRNDKIISVDLETGVRSVYADLTSNGGQIFRDISIDPISKRLFVMDFSLFELNLHDGSFVAKYDTDFLPESTSMVIDNGGDDEKLIICGFNEDGEDVNVAGFSLSGNDFSIVSTFNPVLQLAFANSISFDKENNRYLVTLDALSLNVDQHAVVAINRDTGFRSVFTSSPVGDDDHFSMSGVLSGGAINSLNGIFYVIESDTNKLFEIDLNTGDRSFLSNLAYKNTANNNVGTKDMSIYEVNNVAYLTERVRKSILLVDLTTGEKVIVSKNSNNF